jgi:hypothetical protein
MDHNKDSKHSKESLFSDEWLLFFCLELAHGEG